MAIPGKFEIQFRHWCASCGTKSQFMARSLEWTGKIRKALFCPGCKKNIEKGEYTHRKTNGHISSSPPVHILTLPDESDVVLEEYECSEEEASHFCSIFRDVLQGLPRQASEAILEHWQTGRGSPHVWLLPNRREWSGNGWAGAEPDGLSVYFVSTLISQIPDEHIRTAIAHEFAHTLFVSGKEPNHVQRTNTLESLFEPTDPLLKRRPEWLVWRLMEAWDFDQPAMEEWMERHMIDDAEGLRLRDVPLTDAQFDGKCIVERESIENQLRDMVFPADFEKYRCGKQL